jgi:hypothetical protein
MHIKGEHLRERIRTKPWQARKSRCAIHLRLTEVLARLDRREQLRSDQEKCPF